MCWSELRHAYFHTANAKNRFICVAPHDQDINRIHELTVSIIFVSTVAITSVALLSAWQQIESHFLWR